MSTHLGSQWVEISPTESRFSGFLATPPSSQGPGLVLFQEIFGVNAHIQGVAKQYALDGFVVLAPDLFWRQANRIALGYEGDDRARGIAMMKMLQPAELEADIRAAVEALKARPEVTQQIGAIGFCLGGRLAFIAAATTDISAAVAYYGGGIHDQLDRAISIGCPMQFHYAGRDDNIPMAAVEKVRGTMKDKDAEIFVYEGTHHGFNCWDRGTYDPRASALAHGRSLGFLARQLYESSHAG